MIPLDWTPPWEAMNPSHMHTSMTISTPWCCGASCFFNRLRWQPYQEMMSCSGWVSSAGWHQCFQFTSLIWCCWFSIQTIKAYFSYQLEMWANAQRDGRPAKYRWRPLFNAAQFGWRPLLECRAVTLLRREARWNLLGCPKLLNRSQLLVGTYYILWQHAEEVLLFDKFFSDCRYMP